MHKLIKQIWLVPMLMLSFAVVSMEKEAIEQENEMVYWQANDASQRVVLELLGMSAQNLAQRFQHRRPPENEAFNNRKSLALRINALGKNVHSIAGNSFQVLALEAGDATPPVQLSEKKLIKKLKHIEFLLADRDGGEIFEIWKILSELNLNLLHGLINLIKAQPLYDKTFNFLDNGTAESFRIRQLLEIVVIACTIHYKKIMKHIACVLEDLAHSEMQVVLSKLVGLCNCENLSRQVAFIKKLTDFAKDKAKYHTKKVTLLLNDELKTLSIYQIMDWFLKQGQRELHEVKRLAAFANSFFERADELDFQVVKTKFLEKYFTTSQIADDKLIKKLTRRAGYIAKEPNLNKELNFFDSESESQFTLSTAEALESVILRLKVVIAQENFRRTIRRGSQQAQTNALEASSRASGTCILY